MDIFLNILIYIGLILGGYLIGSINNAVIISNLFFKKDIRDYGSKNAGGTNTGRILGKKAGLTVIMLDVLKPIVVYWGITLLFKFSAVGSYVDYNAVLHFAIILTAVGHCYPIYYNFKGGKAVSVVGGFIIATNWALLIVGLAIFFLILKWKKIVSFASMMTALMLIFLSFLLLIPGAGVTFWPGASQNLYYYIPTLIGICIFLILKHRTNILRLQEGTERKISWLK